MFYGHSMDALSINSITSIVAMAIERTRSLTLEMAVEAERHSEQLRSALLDGFAHAFKTPLTTITLSSSGLLAAEGMNAQQSSLVGLINREAIRLSELTTRMLHTSQLEPSSFILQEKTSNLPDLLQRVLDECAFALKSRNLDVFIEPEIMEIKCDPQVLTLALIQIVDNAAKYGSHNSPVRISARRQESQIILKIHNEGSYIAPFERQKVFTRFYRSPSVDHRAPGTGLGLSIAKKAVEAHGGRISVESDLQAGTAFIVSIPNGTESLV
jgi:two-component system sensor histidine kinase KdpD